MDQVTELGLAYGINTPYTPFTFSSGDDDDGADDDDDAADDDDQPMAAEDGRGYDEAGAGGCSCVLGSFVTRDPAFLPLALGTLLWLVRGGLRRRTH